MQKSVAIIPSVPIVTQVYQFKKMLYRKIGWYHSANSAAHLTVNAFEAGGRYAQIWQDRIDHFCAELRPFTIRFNKIKVLRSSGTIYVSPDETSTDLAKNMMAGMHKYTVGLKAVRIYEPHMTIAKNLSELQLRKAFDLFSEVPVEMSFSCTDLCTRSWNDVKRQYEIESRHRFNGNHFVLPAAPPLQMATLF